MKYKIITIISVLVLILGFIFAKFSLNFKFHNTKNIILSKNPYEITTVKNEENKNRIINLLTNSKLKINGKNRGKGCIFVVKIDNHYVEVQRNAVVVDGYKYITNSDNMTNILLELERIYLYESKS